MEEEKERARVKAIKQREEEAEEKARLASEAQRRDVERLQKERDEEEAAQMRKLAEQVAEQSKEMKVTKKKGQDPSTKVETDVDKLLTKDKKELLREQQALMMDERSEFEKRLESMAKRHDHMERARRQEERALLLLAFDDEQAADRAAHGRAPRLKQMRESASTTSPRRSASRTWAQRSRISPKHALRARGCARSWWRRGGRSWPA